MPAAISLQPQRIIQDVVFGPYESRRFGISLGVNPLPGGARVCNFDCIYCECSTASWPIKWELRPGMPRGDDVRRGLAEAADRFRSDDLDAITICGNGEPSLNRNLEDIVDAVIDARDYYWPQARTVILTNGSMCHKPHVRTAVSRLDERVVKLDAGSTWYMDQMNRPTDPLSINELVWRISLMPDIVIQSMFVGGPVDNSRPEHVRAWIDKLRKVQPVSVQIYTLDREPAVPWVRSIDRKRLQEIALQVEDEVQVPARVY
jgi:wyosine [tRNA(Phe)-imidazoG37] synthetase (radical SAM superfamily)